MQVLGAAAADLSLAPLSNERKEGGLVQRAALKLQPGGGVLGGEELLEAHSEKRYQDASAHREVASVVAAPGRLSAAQSGSPRSTAQLRVWAAARAAQVPRRAWEHARGCHATHRASS